ncbi:MAG: CZB domain-containing protein [Lachnospiraceae bacterium]|nr:CZB domain-containing protein [Lachnospiraceae bacterium]
MRDKDSISQSDKDRLLEAMKEFADGNFDAVSEEDFEDPMLAAGFNNMLKRQVERNNRFLLRLNDAQSRIGDTSCLKSMFEQITEQEEAIKKLQEARLDITPDNRPLSEANQEFLALAAQVRNTFRPCTEDLAEALRCYDMLRVPDNDSWSETEENEQYVILRQLQKSILRAGEKLDSMERRVVSIDEDARGLFEVIDKKSRMSSSFLDGVDTLTKSYKNLSTECLDMGRHLYRISRDIDNTRNDVFRHNSNLNIHDRLKIYEVDHITVAWRLYNNIVEFESLKLTHVNNPDSCKLGLWIANMKDPLFTEAESFKMVAEMHREFHARCVECFLAKQDFDVVRAMDEFANAMDALGNFLGAMDELHEYLRSKGITEETDVRKYRI